MARTSGVNLFRTSTKQTTLATAGMIATVSGEVFPKNPGGQAPKIYPINFGLGLTSSPLVRSVLGVGPLGLTLT